LSASVNPLDFSIHLRDVAFTTVVRSNAIVSLSPAFAGLAYLLIFFKVKLIYSSVVALAIPKSITFPAAYAESILTLYFVLFTLLKYPTNAVLNKEA